MAVRMEMESNGLLYSSCIIEIIKHSPSFGTIMVGWQLCCLVLNGARGAVHGLHGTEIEGSLLLSGRVAMFFFSTHLVERY